MSPITFRNSKIPYYGPHDCGNCGAMICKAGLEWGGTVFTYPKGPIYPNTEWHPHICDPAVVRKQIGHAAENRVKHSWPNSFVQQVEKLGYVIVAEAASVGKHTLIISENQSYYDTPEAAWTGAMRRPDAGFPTWHLDLTKYDVNGDFADDLERVPECPK